MGEKRGSKPKRKRLPVPVPPFWKLVIYLQDIFLSFNTKLILETWKNTVRIRFSLEFAMVQQFYLFRLYLSF
jgi:hypothetical protein